MLSSRISSIPIWRGALDWADRRLARNNTIKQGIEKRNLFILEFSAYLQKDSLLLALFENSAIIHYILFSGIFYDPKLDAWFLSENTHFIAFLP